MKIILKFLAIGIFLSLLPNNQLSAQANKSVELSFHVDGVCNMCKERIENAALIKGVKMASWEKAAQTLTVVYKPSKVSEMAIHEAIAKAGHDTEKLKAKDAVYKSLPGCCAFRDGIEVH